MKAPDSPDRHLDLGCGEIPRNPYGRAAVYGVDIRTVAGRDGQVIATANLAFDAIPFAADSFDSVSAFDFLEHMPRILNGPAPGTTVFPFVRLMDEIWRVLKPGGLFYALTPCYPSVEAFVDPTHVNIITARTHEYFCGAAPPARMYGFEGAFAVRRAQWAIPEHSRVVGPSPWKRR